MSSMPAITPNTMSPASDLSKAAGRTVDNASSSAHDAVDRASNAAGPAVQNLASGAHSMIEKATTVATQAAEKLNVTGEQIRDVQARFSDVCKVQMKENPVMTLGVAVAAGFVISRLLSAR